MKSIMTRHKTSWQWAALNLFAAGVLFIVTTQGSMDLNAQTFDPELESGKWAVRFLLTCLAMTPLNTYLNWHSLIKLRKPAGLWAFAFAVIHVIFLIGDRGLAALSLLTQIFVALGILGFAILAALALTSNHWAMRRLGKAWKRLHRLVYVAGIAVTSHAILATTASKKLMIRDPRTVDELRIYLAVLALLLVVRLPQVRQIKNAIAAPSRRARQPDVQIVPLLVPNQPPNQLPGVFRSDLHGTLQESPNGLPLVRGIDNKIADGRERSDLPLVH